MSFIFNPTQSAKFINQDGTPAPQMILYLNEILNRIGGPSGGVYTSLSSAGSAVIWDFSAAPISTVVLQNGVNVLTALNPVAGYFILYRLTVIQPSAGAPGTITWPANFLFAGGAAPVLSVANNAIDMFLFSSDGTNVYLVGGGLNYS